MNENILGTIILFTAFFSLVIFISIGVALNHHWIKYGLTGKEINKLKVTYFGVSGFLLVVMSIGAILFF